MARPKATPEYPYIVRRVRAIDGKEIPRPGLWGKVYASSATAAVEKFVSTVRVNLMASQFEAEPYREGR